jgi:hypothetical protein
VLFGRLAIVRFRVAAACAFWMFRFAACVCFFVAMSWRYPFRGTMKPVATTVATRHWHRLDDGRVQCDVCPRGCKLREGQRGLCFVRACEGDQVVLTTYGRSSGFCVDPIEKKPLNHFLPGSSVLSFGTAGCNLSCRFCQNWDISKSRKIDTLADAASPERIAEAAAALGCSSVAFTRAGDARVSEARDGGLVRDRRISSSRARTTPQRRSTR